MRRIPSFKLFRNFLQLVILVTCISILFLAVLTASLLELSLLPISTWARDLATGLLLSPAVVVSVVLASGLPKFLLMMFLTPLLLVMIALMRAFARISGGFKSLGKTGKRVELRRDTYGTLTLLAVSLGTTIGPSIFVLAPYSVKHFGHMAVVGMALACASSIALAEGYSSMYRLSRELGERVVGGPSFARIAFGLRSPPYILCRFAMLVGNIALAAFNLLILVEIIYSYILPPFARTSILRWLLTLLFAILAVALRGSWKKALKAQMATVVAFLLAFIAHVIALNFNSHTISIANAATTQASHSDASIIWLILSSSAYVYLTVFGFQETMSLAENVKARDDEERLKKLRIAMVGGTGIASIVFLAYTFLFTVLASRGVRIPDTPIPSLDLVSGNAFAYAITLCALALGVATTYVPAFVAALKHLEELASDVFLVEIGEGASLPLAVAAFVVLLQALGAEAIIRTTDIAILAALILIAASERWLVRAVKGKLSKEEAIRSILTVLSLALMWIVFAVTNLQLVVLSLTLTLASTLVVMMLSYDLALVALFAISSIIILHLIAPPLIWTMGRLAAYELISPLGFATGQLLLAASWSLQIALLVLTFSLTLVYRREVLGAARHAVTHLKKTLEKAWEAIKGLSERLGMSPNRSMPTRCAA